MKYFSQFYRLELHLYLYARNNADPEAVSAGVDYLYPVYCTSIRVPSTGTSTVRPSTGYWVHLRYK